MTTEEGVIIALKDNMAEVKVGRHENCTACGACASAKNITVFAANDIGAAVGERVKFTVVEDNILTGAFMVFVFPLLFATIGAVLAFYLLSQYIIEGSALFFLLSLFIVKLYDRKKGREISEKTRIVEKI